MLLVPRAPKEVGEYLPIDVAKLQLPRSLSASICARLLLSGCVMTLLVRNLLSCLIRLWLSTETFRCCSCSRQYLFPTCLVLLSAWVDQIYYRLPQDHPANRISRPSP